MYCDHERVSAPSPEALAAAQIALRAGAAATAREALAGEPLTAPVLEMLARAAYLDLDFGGAIEQWEQAYVAYRAGDDTVGAVRVARTLGGMYFAIVGDAVVAGGWIGRAQRMLGEVGASAEHGWVALNCGMAASDRRTKEVLFRQALDISRQWRDTDLEVAALAYLGASMVHGDRAADGMALLDDALAAVTGGEIDDLCVLEEVFCQLFAACEHALDVGRADQWIRAGEALAARRGLPGISAFCRTHYGAILTAAGRWREAEQVLTEAIDLWGLGQRSSLRLGAVTRLADLRVRQGRLDEAEALLRELDVDAAVDAARPLAAVHLERGEPAIAHEILIRALGTIEPSGSAAVPVLALLVDVQIAQDQHEAATACADQLVEIAKTHENDWAGAAAAAACGRIAVASGVGDGLDCFRRAIGGFARAGLPLEAARCRLDLARVLAADRPEVAEAEARTALAVFEKLQAPLYVESATALLDELGSPAAPRPQRRPPHQTRDRGAPADRPRAGRQADRGPADAERAHRPSPRLEHPGQAGRREALQRSGLRGPARHARLSGGHGRDRPCLHDGHSERCGGTPAWRSLDVPNRRRLP